MMDGRRALFYHLDDLVKDCVYSSKNLAANCFPASLHIKMRDRDDPPLLIIHFKKDNDCRRGNAFLHGIRFHGAERVVS